MAVLGAAGLGKGGVEGGRATGPAGIGSLLLGCRWRGHRPHHRCLRGALGQGGEGEQHGVGGWA